MKLTKQYFKKIPNKNQKIQDTNKIKTLLRSKMMHTFTGVKVKKQKKIYKQIKKEIKKEEKKRIKIKVQITFKN